AWNLRLLPFWYLMLFLLAGLGVAELARLTALGTAWVIRGSERAVPDVALAAGAADAPDAPDDGEAGPPPPPAAPPATSTGMSRNSIRVIAIAVLAVIATTVALVRV